MIIKLTPKAFFWGTFIFCKELLLTSLLRVALIGYVSLMSILIFPLFAGSFFSLLIIFIPISYFIFAKSALILGFLLATFMVISGKKFLDKKIIYILFSIAVTPFAIFLGTAFGEHNVVYFYFMEWSNILFKLQLPEKLYGLEFLVKVVIIFLMIISVAGFIFGAGVVAGVLNNKILRKLLAPPKSVKKQLYLIMNGHDNLR